MHRPDDPPKNPAPPSAPGPARPQEPAQPHDPSPHPPRGQQPPPATVPLPHNIPEKAGPAASEAERDKRDPEALERARDYLREHGRGLGRGRGGHSL